MIELSGRFDAFHALDSDKQKRIIDAAIREFTDKGFKRASTNAIADAAQIGKGMLFYYFGSKEELFDFLCEYTIEFAKSTYLSRFVFDSDDFLERCQKLMEIKRRALEEYPMAIAFFENFYKEGNEKYFSKYINDTGALREQIIKSIYTNINYSVFRDDIDGRTITTYIKWLFNSYQNELADRFRRGEVNMSNEAAVADEWKRYEAFTNDMRKLFYKEAK